MIEIIQKKAQKNLALGLQEFLLHVILGFMIFEIQYDLLDLQIIFSLFFFWLVLPILKFKPLDLIVFLTILIFNFCTEINNPLWGLFCLISSQFYFFKDQNKIYIMRIFYLLFCNYIFQEFLSVDLLTKNYLKLSVLISFLCFLDYFLISLIRVLLKCLSYWGIYNFIEKNLELEVDYNKIKIELDPMNSTLEVFNEDLFLQMAYALNFILFKESVYNLFRKKDKICNLNRICLEKVTNIQFQLKTILKKLDRNNTEKSIESLIKVSDLFEDLHQFYLDYRLEDIKNV